jgi:hypothetical protein
MTGLMISPATSTAAVVQIRMLGGALILALITAVMNGDLKNTLLGVLNQEEMLRVLRATEAIQMLPDPTRTAVKETFLKGYNMQLRILVGFAGAGIPFTLLMWQAEPVRIA